MSAYENKEVEPTEGIQPVSATTTGGYFNYADPLKSVINIVDIAHSLSNQCRFNGHTTEFYSVAEHSVLCVDYLRQLKDEKGEAVKVSNQTLMAALLHDAAESFISDIPKPFKETIPGIAETEKEVMGAIVTMLELDLDEADWGLVKTADRFMVLREAKEVMAPTVRFKYIWGPWISRYYSEYKEMVDDCADGWSEIYLRCLAPEHAERDFLKYFNDIRWNRI